MNLCSWGCGKDPAPHCLARPRGATALPSALAVGQAADARSAGSGVGSWGWGWGRRHALRRERKAGPIAWCSEPVHELCPTQGGRESMPAQETKPSPLASGGVGRGRQALEWGGGIHLEMSEIQGNIFGV